MSTKTVLVADDEMHVTHILSFKLQTAGINVVTANDGEEAYALACQKRPDLIITDFQMPLLNGFDMCVQLRSNALTAEIPVIMLTARGHKIEPADLARTNIQHLIAKPFSARDLLSRAAELLSIPLDAAGKVAGANQGTP